MVHLSHRIRKLQLSSYYLEKVLTNKEAIFTRLCRGVGRTSQLKNPRWPVKSTKTVLDLLGNAECNAEPNSFNQRAVAQVEKVYNGNIRVRMLYHARGGVVYLISYWYNLINEKEHEYKKGIALKISQIDIKIRKMISVHGGCQR